VIALVNPALPAMYADACIDSDDIDVLVESDSRIIDMPDPEPSAVERAVAEHVARSFPIVRRFSSASAHCRRLSRVHSRTTRELGVHSGVVSDALVDLVERGIVTNAHKGRDHGRTVTGGLFGTQRLRDFAERSGAIDMRSADYTHDLAVMSHLANFHTINSAIEVDLSGQANSEIAGGRYLGAVGGQLDFVRGGVASPEAARSSRFRRRRPTASIRASSHRLTAVP
jgi:acetyl-CoA hydrolase